MPEPKPSPFAEGYGIPDEHRHLILRVAEEIGYEAAAERYCVHPKTIRNWRRRFGEAPVLKHPKKGQTP